MAKNFSKKEAFNFGWKTFKDNAAFLIGVLLIVGIINFFPGIFAEAVKKQVPLLAIIINIAGGILSMLVHMGLIRICLKFCDYQKPAFSDLFSSSFLFFKYAVAALFSSLITIFGLFLLIIPGIVWGIQFGFAEYSVIDKNLGPIAALKRSSAITRGVKGELFIFGILFSAINILGALCLLIGLFVTIPVSMLAVVFIYRKLLAQTISGTLATS